MREGYKTIAHSPIAKTTTTPLSPTLMCNAKQVKNSESYFDRFGLKSKQIE